MNRVAIGIYLLGLMYSMGCTNAKHPPNTKDVEKLSVSTDSICNEKANGQFLWRNGILFHADKTFTGVFKQSDSLGNLLSKQLFYQGKEEGWSEWYYPDGKINARRYFHQGEKDSVHMGWWPNGNPRFEYHFHQGQYNGWFKEWYVSGEPLKAIWYQAGKEIRGTGWRENGKMYMSFEVRNGRLYGLVNPNLCYSLQKENGVFVTGKKNKNPL